ncbi:MAG: TonB-dependent receptor [Planctomycetes bacterium]|nr:TonB-dependent receptor [Planctomycetota bacterium]
MFPRAAFVTGLLTASLLLLFGAGSPLLAQEEPETGLDPDHEAPDEAETPADALPVTDLGPASADEDSAPEDSAPEDSLPRAARPLDVIRVGATRADRVVLDVPESISVLEGADIRERRPPLNLADLLQRVPGVQGQATGPGQGSPTIRGLTGYHVLTLIDGVRLNGSFFRSGPNQYNGVISPLMIDRVEVIRGPGSTLYGSDALGGVILLKSRGPVAPKGTAPGAAWGQARGYVRFTQPLRQGGEPLIQPRLEFSGGVGDIAAFVGFDYLGQGDREGGKRSRTLRNTAFSETNGDAKVVFWVTPKEKLTFVAQRTDLRNGPRTHSTIFSESYRGTSVGSDLRRDLDQSRSLLYLQGETFDRGPFARAKVNVSLQRNYEQQRRVRSNGGATRTGFEIYTLGALAEAESDLPTPLPITLTYGIDYYHDFVDTFETDRGVRRPRGSIADDSSYDRFGSFLRIEVDLDWVRLTGGVRYELARVYARDVDPDPSDTLPFGRLVKTYDGVVGSLGFVVPLAGEQIALVGNAAQGFRAPNLADTTSFRAVSSNGFDSPSPNVKPEQSLTLELGLKWSTPFVRGQLFYAYTFLEDLIQRVPTGRVVDSRDEFVKDNFARGAIQAIDGELELRLDPLLGLASDAAPTTGLAFLVRGSWVRGDADARINGRRQKDDLRRAPPARIAFTLRWEEPESAWLWAEIENELYRAQRRLSVGDKRDTQRIPPGGSPGFALWHVRVGVRLADERLKLSAALENVFDRDYRLHGSGTNGPGRRVTFALEATW